MNTEITVTFPYYVETSRAMRILREALLGHDEACDTFAGYLMTLTGPREELPSSRGMTVSKAVGAVVFPEGDPKGLRMKQADVRLLLEYMQAHDYSPMDVECILRDRDEHYADARAEEVAS